jgi:hypothetical protein
MQCMMCEAYIKKKYIKRGGKIKREVIKDT